MLFCVLGFSTTLEVENDVDIWKFRSDPKFFKSFGIHNNTFYGSDCCCIVMGPLTRVLCCTKILKSNIWKSKFNQWQLFEERKIQISKTLSDSREKLSDCSDILILCVVRNILKKLIPTTNKFLASLLTKTNIWKLKLNQQLFKVKKFRYLRNSQIQGKTLGLFGHSYSVCFCRMFQRNSSQQLKGVLLK